MMREELIDALRYCAEHEGCDYYIAKECPRESTWMCGVDCNQILMLDAAAALKAADKRIAELMPKDGEWIDEQRGRWIYAKCNLCGKVQDVRSNYCPNCGAKMKGERNDHQRM